MPEYLAPGVYVEETSFRAKSIEGVSTSTTAFAGPTRRGPFNQDLEKPEVPELVTSFADFQRIYGGVEDLFGRPNYLAHAVRAYFNEGGGRLYVSRVYLPPLDGTGHAVSSAVAAGVTFVSRFPGASGNGRITLRQMETPATAQTMATASVGSLLRTGGDNPAGPAELQAPSGGPTFSVKTGQTLIFTVAGGDATGGTITFRGSAAEITGTALDATIDLTGAPLAERTLQVSVGGEPQSIVLAAQEYTPEQLADEVGAQIRGGYARLAEPGRDRLILGTEQQGRGASIAVTVANDNFGFATPEDDAVPEDDPAVANVADLGRVSVAELNDLLEDAGVRATLTADDEVWFSTVDVGAGVTLTVGAGTANAAFGLAEDDEATGTEGPVREYYLKGVSGWESAGGDAPPPEDIEAGAEFLTLAVVAEDAEGNQNIYEGLAFDAAHPRWIGHVLAEKPSRRADHLENLFAIRFSGAPDALALRQGLFGSADETVVTLTGGSDGLEPTQAAYEMALVALRPLDDISIVAAPGHTAFTGWEGIQGALISHVSRRRAYQIAVLDTPPDQTVGDARLVRSRIDSSYAALYFPWVTVANPLARPGREDIPREIQLPPSGFVSGIYARNDVERGVHKAPANEVVRGALRFETDVNYAQQEVLNPIGVNCLRFFPGRGFRVWGARTVSSDPEWKYVNVRRYFNYLERSIDQGTQWAVFESNGERLWANVRETISSFLYNEWRSGALLGTSPKEAFFVKCDRSTMTQNDLDNGRLICLVGVAVLKPAEFVIFRIGQKTADARS